LCDNFKHHFYDNFEVEPCLAGCGAPPAPAHVDRRRGGRRCCWRGRSARNLSFGEDKEEEEEERSLILILRGATPRHFCCRAWPESIASSSSSSSRGDVLERRLWPATSHEQVRCRSPLRASTLHSPSQRSLPPRKLIVSGATATTSVGVQTLNSKPKSCAAPRADARACRIRLAYDFSFKIMPSRKKNPSSIPSPRPNFSYHLGLHHSAGAREESTTAPVTPVSRVPFAISVCRSQLPLSNPLSRLHLRTNTRLQCVLQAQRKRGGSQSPSSWPESGSLTYTDLGMASPAWVNNRRW